MKFATNRQKSRLPIANRAPPTYHICTVRIGIADHEGKELTGHEMHKMVSDHWADLGHFVNWPFSAWFDFVRLIPYESDDSRFPARVIELVPRPAYLLDRNLFPRIDCKKKSILLGAWARGNGFPYRFIAVSHRGDKAIHHVFPQIDFGRGWVNADATFPDFHVGQSQPATFAAELTP